ncbi:hypothetical protein ABT187_48655, partial [Streptomyces sp. NPDC001817]|uniref:hypothetical protein n=1 Tax=Streptomyces sp. NPDC001817 TaxID=3154398 RepID=UPI00331ECCC8
PLTTVATHDLDYFLRDQTVPVSSCPRSGGNITRRLLHDIGHAIEPAETHLATLDDLTDLATHLGVPAPEIKTASY